MNAWIKSLCDGSDHTAEMHLVLTAFVVVGFVALAVYSVWHGQAFDPAAYGTGAGATFAGTGAAAWGTGLQRKNQGEG